MFTYNSTCTLAHLARDLYRGSIDQIAICCTIEQRDSAAISPLIEMVYVTFKIRRFHFSLLEPVQQDKFVVNNASIR